MPRGEDLSKVSAPALAAELATGNVDAFQELVRREGAELIRYGTRILLSRQDARDAAQEAFDRLWQSRARLRPGTDPVRLLHTIIRSLARDRLRFRKATGPQPLAEGPHVVEARPLFPGIIAPGIDIQTAMHHALNGLSRRQREIVILRWNQRMTYEEIGAKLGIAPGTASAHMQRAIAHLKAVLPLPFGDRSRPHTETG